MSDFYLDLSGDILISSNKDITIAQSRQQRDLQQIYIRLMTEPNDFTIYPRLGCDLSMLRGMPQNRTTAEIGKRIIRDSLENELKGGIFRGRSISIDAVPISATGIRFDVHIEDNSSEPITLSVVQEL
jgi:hypothetical protein